MNTCVQRLVDLFYGQELPIEYKTVPVCKKVLKTRLQLLKETAQAFYKKRR